MRKVIIEVSGGVADVTSCPDDVEVEIIDHDNEDFICSKCGKAVDALSMYGGEPYCDDCILKCKGIFETC